MTFFKFGKNDIFHNRIKTHPKVNFKIYDQKVVCNNRQPMSGTGVESGYIDLYEFLPLPTPVAISSSECYVVLDSGSWSSDAKLGSYSLFFSGSSGNPERVSFGTNMPGVTGSGFTISMWIKPHRLFTYNALISKWNEGVGNGRVWSFFVESNRLRGDSTSDGVTWASNRVTGSTTISTGSWQHVVFIYGTTTNDLYYNGNIDGSRARATNGIYSSSLEVFLGHSPSWSGGSRYFSGTIDEVAIWNIPLSASQITSLYNNGTGTAATNISPGNLTAYYTMEPDDGISTGPGFDSLKNQVTSTPTGTLLDMNTGSYINICEESPPVILLDSGSWSSDAKLGSYSLDFTGTVGISSSYVEVGSQYDLGITSTGFTISMWIKPRSLVHSIWKPLVAKWREGLRPTNDHVFYFGINSDKLEADTFSSSVDLANHPVTGSTTISTGSWQHVAFTYDATYNILYYNGSQDGILNRPTDGVISQSIETHIGYANTFTFSSEFPTGKFIYFDGLIDEVAFWNTPLNSSQISQLYNSGSGISATSVNSGSLVAYYTMESDCLTTGPGYLYLKNQVASAPTGTLINMRSGTAAAAGC